MSKTSKKVDPHAPWIQAETVLSSSGLKTKGTTADEAVYFARVFECDGRKSEALAETHDVTTIQRLRTMIQRGKFDDAAALLPQTGSEAPIEAAEVFLEEARLHNFRGQWLACLDSCNKAVDAKPAGLTLQTVIQVRSLALFELGEFASCARDLDLLKSMSRLYPSSQASLYARITLIKLFAVQNQNAHARRELDQLWMEFKSKNRATLDFLLVLLRAESSVAFCSNQTPLRFAIAAGLVAKNTGEEFYQGLALLESAGASQLDSESESILALASAKYERIKRSLEEIHSVEERVSTSSAIVRNWQKTNALLPALQQESANFILISKQNLLIQLHPFKIHHLSADNKLRRILEELAHGKVAKDLLFRNVWDLSKFVPHLHENLVFQTVGRVRRTLNVEIKTENGHFEAIGLFCL